MLMKLWIMIDINLKIAIDLNNNKNTSKSNMKAENTVWVFEASTNGTV